LNVYAPKTVTEPVAVMLWIHGGCYVSGDAYAYPGTYLTQTGNVISVIIHYRLGIFGFLGADQLRERDLHGSTGNYGHLDALHALKWV
jgi:carboxylesterase type B